MSPQRLTALAASLILAASAVRAGEGEAAADWRQTAPDSEKIARLLEVMPSTGVVMIELGERYKNLYWAGRQGRWEFAGYQLEEIEEGIERVMITRPARAATAKVFLERGVDELKAAIQARDAEAFSRGFETMRGECVACHARNDHGFITLPAEPATASSPVLNLGR